MPVFSFRWSLPVKAELDQFKEGLLQGMSLVEIQQNHDLFLPVFTSAGEKPLTAGLYFELGSYIYIKMSCIHRNSSGTFCNQAFW